MDPLEIIRSRLICQRLAGKTFEQVTDAVGWLGAVQAQEFAEAKWSLAERVTDATDATVENAFSSGDIIRTHALRPTWHFLARDDARWILRLTKPRVHALNAYWYRKSELNGALFARAGDVFARALADGAHLTRPVLADRLSDAGINAAGPRLAYLLMHAELEEQICSGPRRGRQHTYALFDNRVPTATHDDRDHETALDDLVHRYFRSHGPATVHDFTTWSSLPVRESRASLERLGSRIEAVPDANGTKWYHAGHVASASLPSKNTAAERLSGAFLLPTYDEMIVAYQDLRIVLDAALPRSDFIERAIVIDGTTVGTWKRTLSSRSAVVNATLLRELSVDENEALAAAVERFGRFLGLPTTGESIVAV